MNKIEEIAGYEFFRIGSMIINLENLIGLSLIVIFTLLILWIIRILLYRKKFIEKHDIGKIYSLYQISKYVIWIISILMIIETLGLKLNVLLAGSAALLVGIGLGLQNTFNNFVAGIILLFEGSIKVGDILEVDNEIIKIENIGIRTSMAINRDDVTIILPNSFITSNKVINWSHQKRKTRFKISVGVAYGSDVDLVMQLLKESAMEHEDVCEEQLILPRFLDFGNSSLNFELLFFSENIFRIENVKSDIRKKINQKFNDNNVTIPFPQMDVYIKKI